MRKPWEKKKSKQMRKQKEHMTDIAVKDIGPKAISISFYVNESSKEIFCNRMSGLRILYHKEDSSNNKHIRMWMKLN